MSNVKKKDRLRILIVEDHEDIAENIADYLEAKGYILDFAMDGLGGLHLALTQNYDAIVLDIMLPGMDGLTFCRKLRKEGNKRTPVLMLTARDTLSDKLDGFEAGADDYLIKPFALEELNARLGALVRRSEIVPQKMQIADLEFDPGTMKVYRSEKEIKLNRVCLRILQILMQSSPNIVKRSDLEQTLWGDMPPGSDALRSHIYALRQAIDKPFETPLLQTIHGIGYRLTASDEIST